LAPSSILCFGALLNKLAIHLNKRITSSINKNEEPINLHTNKIKATDEIKRNKLFHSGGG